MRILDKEIINIQEGVQVKKKMTIRIIIGIIVVIIIAAIIMFRPSGWSDSGDKTIVNLTVNGKSGHSGLKKCPHALYSCRI